LFTVLAVSLVAANASKYTSKPTEVELLVSQKRIYELFMYVSQTLTDTYYYEIGHNYDIAGYIDHYTDRVTI
jgi:hypothetical protein